VLESNNGLRVAVELDCRRGTNGSDIGLRENRGRACGAHKRKTALYVEQLTGAVLLGAAQVLFPMTVVRMATDRAIRWIYDERMV
jgi:hypothetical protein